MGRFVSPEDKVFLQGVLMNIVRDPSKPPQERVELADSVAQFFMAGGYEQDGEMVNHRPQILKAVLADKPDTKADLRQIMIDTPDVIVRLAPQLQGADWFEYKDEHGKYSRKVARRSIFLELERRSRISESWVVGQSEPWFWHGWQEPVDFAGAEEVYKDRTEFEGAQKLVPAMHLIESYDAVLDFDDLGSLSRTYSTAVKTYEQERLQQIQQRHTPPSRPSSDSLGDREYQRLVDLVQERKYQGRHPPIR